MTSWDYFDEVKPLKVSSWGDKNDTYMLAVKLDQAAGYYDGYIYKRYASSETGGFVQTIRGAYTADSALVVNVNEDDKSFVVQGDTWCIELDDMFYMMDIISN